MTLRKAELIDFTQFCVLYAESSYQVLYLPDESDEEHKVTDEEINSVLDMLQIDLEFINSQYENLSQERYEEMLKNKKIFLLEDDNGQIVGYISAIVIKRYSYRIDEIAMINRKCDAFTLRTIIADLVSKIPNMKEISIFPSNKKAKEILEMLEFQKDRGGIYSKRM